MEQIKNNKRYLILTKNFDDINNYIKITKKDFRKKAESIIKNSNETTYSHELYKYFNGNLRYIQLFLKNVRKYKTLPEYKNLDPSLINNFKLNKFIIYGPV